MKPPLSYEQLRVLNTMDGSVHPYGNEIELSEIQREFRTTVNNSDQYNGNRTLERQYLPVVGRKKWKLFTIKAIAIVFVYCDGDCTDWNRVWNCGSCEVTKETQRVCGIW